MLTRRLTARFGQSVQEKVTGLLENDLLSEDEANALQAQAKDALLSSFGPAYEAIITWAEEERLSSPEVATGIGRKKVGMPTTRTCSHSRQQPI